MVKNLKRALMFEAKKNVVHTLLFGIPKGARPSPWQKLHTLQERQAVLAGGMREAFMIAALGLCLQAQQ